MECVKTVVQDDLTATISCPFCNVSKGLSVADFKNKMHSLRVRCICGEIFLALLEFRKHKRKPVLLKGTYHTHYQYVQTEGKMVISDLSAGGFRCQVNNTRGMQEGCIIELEYIVHDVGQRTVQKQAVIRHAQGMTLGCEFVQFERV